MIRSIVAAWTSRQRPWLGALVVAYGAVMVIVHPWMALPVIEGDPNPGVVTLISWLPESWQHSRTAFLVARGVAIVGAVGWLSTRFVPWSAWATVAGFTISNALFLESWVHASHTSHLLTQVLLVHALWFHVERRALREAWATGRFWSTEVQPGWVVEASIALVAAYHAHAGLSKLLDSGLSWANGTTMQLLVHQFGQPEAGWLTSWIVASRPLAQLLQVAALLVEVGAVFLVVPGAHRAVIGLGLVGFYAGVLTIFGWPFGTNLVLTALLCLPVDRALQRVADDLTASRG